MYLYARLQKGECFGCWRGAQLFSVRGDAKPARHCKALGKPLQEDRVSLPVQGPDPTAPEHPFLWAVRSSRRACSVSQQGFFSEAAASAWHGGREGKQHLALLVAGSADRLTSGVHLLRLSSVVFLGGKDDSHTGHGERCYVRGL